MSRRTLNKLLVGNLVALALFSTPALAADDHELFLHGFRAPAIGPELRWGPVGVFAGLYPTVLSADGVKSDTWWIKTGVTGYLGQFRLTGERTSGFYLSVAYLRGLTDGWKANAVAFDGGFRWAIWSGLEARLGASVLKAAGRDWQVNPAGGVSWAFSL